MRVASESRSELEPRSMYVATSLAKEKFCKSVGRPGILQYKQQGDSISLSLSRVVVAPRNQDVSVSSGEKRTHSSRCHKVDESLAHVFQ